MTAELWVTTLVGLAAAAEDLARRTVSNWIPLAALAGGIVCQSVARGWRGLAAAALGAAGGYAVFFLFYWLCGRGGGDVKLMAGFGALLGPSRLPEGLFWTSLTGGLIAAAVLMAAWLRSVGGRSGPAPRAIPYAPAIAVGTWLALVGEG